MDLLGILGYSNVKLTNSYMYVWVDLDLKTFKYNLQHKSAENGRYQHLKDHIYAKWGHQRA